MIAVASKDSAALWQPSVTAVSHHMLTDCVLQHLASFCTEVSAAAGMLHFKRTNLQTAHEQPVPRVNLYSAS